jgi:heme exporter protein B
MSTIDKNANLVFKENNFWKQVYTLIQKDAQLEWRQKSAVGGLLLYVVATALLSFLAFKSIDGLTWVTLYWLMLVFAAVNAVAKSFMAESRERMRFYYGLASPQAIIMAKLLYNCGLLIIIAGLGLIIFSMLFGNPIENMSLFVVIAFLGAVGFSFCFTLVSAIAAQTGGNAALMPILSFPIIIPVFILLLSLSKIALIDTFNANFALDLGNLLAINVLLLVLSVILFQFVWKE